MQKIMPFLWFDDQAEAAISFYISVFKDAKILELQRYPAEGGEKEGKVMSVSFQLEGQHYHALNGGPHFSFTPAISLFVNCDSQAEVDAIWNKFLAAGGTEGQCGWLQDKWGLSWQIIPHQLGDYLSDPDPVKSGRVMEAMMQMKKIEVSKLKAAYEGK